MATILLVRHGETDWNLERRWQGHADRPLNETGRAQARALAHLLAGDRLEAVYASDLSRALQTAEIVADRHAGLAVQIDPRLREVDVGEWSGLTLAEAEERYPDGVRRRLAGGTGWDHGETYEQMGERVVGALREIGARHEGNVLVVSHGGSIREVWIAAGGDPSIRPHIGNCDVHRVTVRDGDLRWID